ncbi:MAG TPA: response regulator transcription factor [Caulobacteraceae bacterium]|jgi:DNA-binding response OmpR family regulator|nr:response regulator transcription factor [Caulobacteraceae bacterium]
MNILLIEDDPGIGRFVSRGLAAEGYAVEWLQRGRGASERLRTNGFAAAILDLGLPDIDGMELCSALRREGVDTPVLMLTARDALEDKLDGFRCGADDYLAKPFAFEELLARLNVLARRGVRQGAGLAVGTLSMDLGRRAATVADKPLALSRREFDVLACLARRPGAVLSRQEILDEAWGPGADVAENTVDVYVGYLRRRLASVSGAPVIESVRGQGFRLTAVST